MDPEIWQLLISRAKIKEPSFNLIQTDRSGRGLAATRILQPDEVIFEETPLTIGPPQNVGPKFCVGCSRKETPNVQPFVECPNKCGSLMCSVNCNFKDRHKKSECEVLKSFVDNNKKSATTFLQSQGRWLTIFRALLLKMLDKKDRHWDSLLTLEDHLDDRQGCEVMNRNLVDVVKPLVELFHSKIFTPTEIVRVCAILDSNSFRIDGTGNRGLYSLASMINHDCDPNSRVSFDSNATLTLRARREIGPGEEITITYCSPLMGTQARLEKLRSSKFFTCCCSRCDDPGELDSNLSSLRCPKCQGNIVPREKFRELEQSTEWICQKCCFVTTNEKVEKLLEAVQKGIKDTLSKTDLEPEKIEEILEKRYKVLMPEHYLLLELKLDLLSRYEKISSLSSIERRLELIRERILVLETVDNGHSRLEGFLHYRLQGTLVEKVSLLHRTGKLKESEAKEIGLQIRKSLEIAAKCLIGDAGCPTDLINILKAIQ